MQRQEQVSTTAECAGTVAAKRVRGVPLPVSAVARHPSPPCPRHRGASRRRSDLDPGPGMRSQRGTVTAESALVLPLVAAFAMALVWMVSVAIEQVQTVDAARDAARALARGDDAGVVDEQALRTAPAGSSVDISHSGGLVTVSVSVVATPPGWLLVPLPGVTVGSRSTVQVEDDVSAQP